MEDSKSYNLPFSGHVAGYCTENNCSSSDLSARAGISKSHLSRLISGERSLSWNVAKKFASLLKMSPEEVMESFKYQLKIDLLQEEQRQKDFGFPDKNTGPLNLGPTGFPIKKNLLGLQKKLEKIVKWHGEAEYPLLFLHGIHGQGCSSLAWLACCIILGCSRFFWISFANREKSFYKILLDCIQHYQVHCPSSAQVSIDTPEEAMHYLLHLFEQKPTVVVLDGIGRHMRDYNEVDGPRETGEFLKQLSILKNCRTIVTTHLIPSELTMLEGCHTIKVGPLSPEDSLEYLKKRGVSATKDQLTNYVASCLGNPLALEKIADELLRAQQIPGLQPPSKSWLLQRIHDDFIGHLKSRTCKVARLCCRHSHKSKGYIFTYEDLMTDHRSQPSNLEEIDALAKSLFELISYGLLASEDKDHFYLHPVYREILRAEIEEVK